MKLKLFEVMQGCEYLQELEILEALKQPSIKDYAYILHDKDSDSKPHYHVAVRLNHANDSKYVARWFGVKEQYVEKVKGRWSDMLKYLIHQNAPEKYQYEESEVKSNYDWKTNCQ
jgi:hypothetical protein